MSWIKRNNQILLMFLLFVTTNVFAQNEMTFTVENIDKATTLLETKPYRDVILTNFADSLEAYNFIDYELVSFGAHSFFEGLHRAYADHRPFVISPDMIWLLICQGFANHINYNSYDLKDLLVDFSAKRTLIVKNDSIVLGNPQSPWQEVFPEFTTQIGDNVGDELVNLLTDTFSTTTIDKKIAFEITLMDAMEPYFEYQVFYAICGIPEITLQGTTEDWKKILRKTKQLAKYDLDWWVDDLVPILKKIVRTSKGRVRKDFWQNMFKVHTSETYGNPKTIDGWIVKFFPYDKYGNRIDLTKRTEIKVSEIIDELPNEIVTVNFDYIMADMSGNEISRTKMEFWAGFVGLHQNNKTLAVTPEIGWFVTHKLPPDELVKSDKSSGIVFYNVREFPKELLSLPTIYDLTINYINEINIPDEVMGVKIWRMNLNGAITESEIKRIKTLLPKTSLSINGKSID